MRLPQNPVILLSYVNTKLRDEYPSLSAFCENEEAQEKEIIEKLARIGYTYSPENNQFI